MRRRRKEKEREREGEAEERRVEEFPGSTELAGIYCIIIQQMTIRYIPLNDRFLSILCL